MLRADGLLFLGVAGLRVVADDAHDMGLMTFIIDRVAHGLAVYGEALVFLSIDVVPALRALSSWTGSMRISTSRMIPSLGNNAVAVFNAAAEARPRPLAEALCPV